MVFGTCWREFNLYSSAGVVFVFTDELLFYRLCISEARDEVAGMIRFVVA